MALLVQKFGGTSVGTTDRIKNVARRVARQHAEGNQMVIVVSAMSGETNRLLGLAKEISGSPDPRELDVIASTGEQVTIGLLSIALHAPALSPDTAILSGLISSSAADSTVQSNAVQASSRAAGYLCSGASR